MHAQLARTKHSRSSTDNSAVAVTPSVCQI
jgi:hypothetical protein